ncbi:hypothetical protein RCL1_000759 [Eukaryota sp. TZLM3-RCL]
MFTLSNNDFKASESIQRRRALAEARLQRIQDDKLRCIGIDTEALQRQIDEKDHFRNTQVTESFLFDKHMLSLERQLLASVRQQTETEKCFLSNLNEFRKTCQGHQLSDTYDLNNTKAHHQELSTFERYMNNDPNVSVGPSSAIIFDGEDLEYNNRVKAQQEQQKAWCMEQSLEKQSQLQRQALEDSLYDANLLQMMSQLQELEQECQDSKRQEMLNLLNTNMKLATEMREKRREEEELDHQLSHLHATNVVNSQLLTEDPRCTVSCLAPHRKVPYNFKGFSEEEVENILRIREEQITQKQDLLKTFKQTQHMADVQVLKQTRQLELLERQKQRQEKENALKLRRELEEQARLVREKKKEKEDVFVSDQFLNSFGRSHR